MYWSSCEVNFAPILYYNIVSILLLSATLTITYNGFVSIALFILNSMFTNMELFQKHLFNIGITCVSRLISKNSLRERNLHNTSYAWALPNRKTADVCETIWSGTSVWMLSIRIDLLSRLLFCTTLLTGWLHACHGWRLSHIRDDTGEFRMVLCLFTFVSFPLLDESW